MAEYRVTIHNGFVRLYHDGRVEHYDAAVSSWRGGWGVWGTVACFGADERTLNEWKRDVANIAPKDI